MARRYEVTQGFFKSRYIWLEKHWGIFPTMWYSYACPYKYLPASICRKEAPCLRIEGQTGGCGFGGVPSQCHRQWKSMRGLGFNLQLAPPLHPSSASAPVRHFVFISTWLARFPATCHSSSDSCDRGHIRLPIYPHFLRSGFHRYLTTQTPTLSIGNPQLWPPTLASRLTPSMTTTISRPRPLSSRTAILVS